MSVFDELNVDYSPVKTEKKSVFDELNVDYSKAIDIPAQTSNYIPPSQRTESFQRPEEQTGFGIGDVASEYGQEILQTAKDFPTFASIGLKRAGQSLLSIPQSFIDVKNSIKDNARFKLQEFVYNNPKLKSILGYKKNPDQQEKLIAGEVKNGTIKKIIDNLSSSIEKEQSKLPEEYQSAKITEKPIYKLIEGITTNIPQIGIAALSAYTGNPNLGINILSGMAGADQFQSALEETGDIKDAISAGVSSYYMNKFTEKVIPELSKGKIGLKETVKIGNIGALQESFQGYLDDVITQLTYDESVNPTDLNNRLTDAAVGFFYSAIPGSKTLIDKAMKPKEEITGQKIKGKKIKQTSKEATKEDVIDSLSSDIIKDTEKAEQIIKTE